MQFGTAEMRLITVDSSKRGITPRQRLKWSETPTQTMRELTCSAGAWHRLRTAGGASSESGVVILQSSRDFASNTFALRSPKAIHLISGEHGKIWGRLGVGWRAGEQKWQYLWNA